ncbi:MAG TPA: YhdT family protein [Tissierellaceae bacterium]|nr:YhdT family protein [Tissierellaceae bacterium]
MKERDGDKDQLELNEEGFYEDPRYKQCNREAIYGVLLGIGNLIWWFAFGYGLGDRPVSEYSYILGFPSWFFMSSVLGGLVFIILTFVMVNKGFKDMPLNKFTKEDAEEYLKNERSRR